MVREVLNREQFTFLTQQCWCSDLPELPRWHNRLARRTYKQYQARLSSRMARRDMRRLWVRASPRALGFIHQKEEEHSEKLMKVLFQSPQCCHILCSNWILKHYDIIRLQVLPIRNYIICYQTMQILYTKSDIISIPSIFQVCNIISL